MTELWSEDKKDLEIKAKIISECAYLPEFFPEFPDKDLPKEEAEAAAVTCEEVKKYMSGKEIKRIIVVPNRIINVVG